MTNEEIQSVVDWAERNRLIGPMAEQLLKAVKHLQNRVEELEQENQALKISNNTMQTLENLDRLGL